MFARVAKYTLFPYTTLFRSRVLDGHRQQRGRRGQNTPPAVGNRRRFREPQGAHSGAARQDRKSTRLNSSDRTISYAVFCLKKKNTKTTSINIQTIKLKP